MGIYENEGNFCVEESFDTKMMMIMVRKVKQRRTKQGLRASRFAGD